MAPDPDQYYLTSEKKAELERELEELKFNKRKEIAEALEYAKSLGDLSENSEYQEAREDQRNVEERIIKLEDIIKNAVLVKERHEQVIDIGSHVVVRRTDNGEIKEFLIVGSEESDVFNNKISNESPLGKVLLSKKKGDVVRVETPKSIISYTVVDVI